MNHTARITTCFIFAVILFLGVASVAYADLEDVKQATVSIASYCPTSEGTLVSTGSGFLVSADGFIVTNAHVIISNDTTVDVKIGERTHTIIATIYYRDSFIDLAVLKVQLGGLDYLVFGDDSELKLGQRLFAVGSPLIFTDIFTDGIYSGYFEELGMIQHTAELSSGNSGGPLVTEDGVVVGVNTSVIQFPGESRYNFAIPISLVKAVLDGLFSQEYIYEIQVECADESAPVVEPPPIEEPYDTTPSTPDISGLIVDGDYVTYVLLDYPTGWMEYSRAALHYYFDLPDFYSYEFTSVEEFELDGFEFFGSYNNYDDPYFAAVPMVSLYIGFPGSESFYKFKQRIEDMFEWDGFVKDRSFEIEDIETSQVGLEFDGYWFDGAAGSDYSALSRATYFIRDKDLDTYYCLDFMFNTQMGDVALDEITIPLIIQILWTFSTKI